MKSTYAKINPEDKGSSFSKKTKKPQPIAKTPMSARTSAIKVYILLGNRAKFDDKANDTKEMEKNKMVNCSSKYPSAYSPADHLVIYRNSPAPGILLETGRKI